MAVHKFTQAEFQKCLSPTLLASTQQLGKKDWAGRVIKNIGEMAVAKLQRIIMLFSKGKWLNNNSVMKLMKENITDLTKILRENKGKEFIHKALTPTVKAMRATCDLLGTSGANKKTLKEVDKVLKPLEALVSKPTVKKVAQKPSQERRQELEITSKQSPQDLSAPRAAADEPPAAVPVPQAAAGPANEPRAAAPVLRPVVAPQPKPPQEPSVEVPKAKEPAAPVAAQPPVFKFDFTPAAPPLRVQAREQQPSDFSFTTPPHVRESHNEIVEVVKTLREDFKDDEVVLPYINQLIPFRGAPAMKERFRALKTILEGQSIPIAEATTAKLNRIEQLIEDYSNLSS